MVRCVYAKHAALLGDPILQDKLGITDNLEHCKLTRHLCEPHDCPVSAWLDELAEKKSQE